METNQTTAAEWFLSVHGTDWDQREGSPENFGAKEIGGPDQFSGEGFPTVFIFSDGSILEEKSGVWVAGKL